MQPEEISALLQTYTAESSGAIGLDDVLSVEVGYRLQIAANQGDIHRQCTPRRDSGILQTL
jgi:hypothetical protein